MRYVTAVFLFMLMGFLLAACQPALDPVDGGFVIGQYALVPRESSLHVVNIADASNPRFTTQVTLPGPVDDLNIWGRQAYISYLTPFPGGGFMPGGVQIVDVAKPQEPVMQQAFGLNLVTNDFLVTGDQGFRADYDQITLLDMADPDNTSRQTLFGTGANALSRQGDDLFGVWGGCAIRTPNCSLTLTRYNLADSPNLTATAVFTSTELPGYNVLSIGHFAIIGGRGVGVVDMTQTPLTLVSHVSYENASSYYTQLAHQGHILYVLDAQTLHLLDTSNLPQLTPVGAVEVAYQFARLTVRGDFAYIAGETVLENGTAAGLFIVNVADAERPFVVSYYDALAQP